jgi:ParB family transcriptional regulator, chromosome partitioning protein
MEPSKKRTGLGKGLQALLSDTGKSGESSAQDSILPAVSPRHSSGVDLINVSQIETNPYQPRTHFDQEALRELADSIRVQGIIQPITVRQLSADQYQLISGERRLQASRLAGLEQVPAYVRKANDQQMLEMALIENIQRENLNALEIALSYQRLLAECQLKQEELGDRVGKKRATVNNYLRLLKLPPEIQAGIRDGEISMGHARALVNVEHIEDQLFLFNKIVREQWSVRQVEEAVRKLAEGKDQNPAPKKEIPAVIDHLRQQLSSHFGSKVQIKAGKDEKGEIRIPFLSTEDLNRILELLRL